MKKFEKLDADTAERAEKAAEEITRRSKETYKKIKGYLDQAHERYAKKGTLTMDDMRKFNRLKNLENAIAEAIEENRILTDKEIEKLLSESAKSALYVCTKAGGGGRKEKSIRAIKKEIDVAEILDETVAGRNWKERTKHLSANTAYDIITEVRKGIDQGDSFHDMAKAIKKKMGEYNGRPITIAKTETHRVIETTKFKAMESVSKQVPQLKVWRTVSDERVRDSHKAMEGQTVKLDEEFTLPSGAKTMYPGQSGIPAEDINCRCFVEYIDAPKEVEDYDAEIAETLDFSEEKGYNINEQEQEESNKGKNRNFRIDSEFINSNDYDKKFAQIDTDKNIQRILKQSAREILYHRDGQEFEDLYFIDSENGNILKSIFYEEKRKAKTTKAMTKMVKKAKPNTIIVIHNHAGSLPPSEMDIIACSQRKHKYGIIPCHDGTIWKYETSDNISLIKYNVAYDKFRKSNYTKLEEFIKEVESGGVKLWKI